MTEAYWLDIAPSDATESDDVFSGVLSGAPTPIRCPNCGTNMFPVFNFRRGPVVRDLPDCFFDGGVFFWDVCARCSHSLGEYAVTYHAGGRLATHGYVTDRKTINAVDEPYRSRSVRLIPIAGSFWSNADELERYARRRLRDGISHQLGGLALRRERSGHTGCLHCKAATEYIGTIDYDDFNVPLCDNGQPLGLIIGDLESLNVYLCRACHTLTYCLTD